MVWPFSRGGGSSSRVGIEEADVALTGTDKDSLRDSVLEEADNAAVIRESDIEYDEEEDEVMVDGVEASDLEDLTILDREKRRETGLSEDDPFWKLEDYDSINFVNSLGGIEKSNDKRSGRYKLEDAFHGIRNSRMAFSFDEYFEDIDEAEENLRPDTIVVERPEEGSQGKGLEFKYLKEIDEFEENKIYTEPIDHYTQEDILDCRVFYIGDTFVVAERSKDLPSEYEEADSLEDLDLEDIGPGNLNDDTYDVEYEILDEGDKEELRQESEELAKVVEATESVQEEFDMEIGAFDFALREGSRYREPQVIGYENNSTPQTGLDDVSETSIPEKTAEVCLNYDESNSGQVEITPEMDSPFNRATVAP